MYYFILIISILSFINGKFINIDPNVVIKNSLKPSPQSSPQSEDVFNKPIKGGSPFWWNQTNPLTGKPIRYMINGTNYYYIIDNGTEILRGTSQAVIAVDPYEERIYIDFGSAGGQFYVLKNNWYNANDAFFPPGACATITPQTYLQEIIGYTSCTSKIGSTFKKATYNGLVQDAGACRLPYALLGTHMEVEEGIIVNWIYSELNNIPLGENFTFICANTEAELVFDPKTVNMDPIAINNLFNQMPSSCNPNTPYNYCDILFSSDPVLNPCSLKNSAFNFTSSRKRSILNSKLYK